MTLGQIISRLEQEDPMLELPHGFAHPHSYRGDYAQLAFEPEHPMKVGDSLNVIRSCIGRHFAGWKGGAYCMGLDTECRFAMTGHTSDDVLGPMLLDALIAIAKANMETP